MDDAADIREQIFHNTVREYVIIFLLFLMLIVASYLLVRRFRRRENQDYLFGDDDDDEAAVYRIAMWLCTFSLAVAMGAALLLPISIASNEVLLYYPDSYYVKWLNSSLIQGLWNYIFLFSNLSLFVLLPFAYLFTESEGFTGYRKGLMARVYETFVVLCLLALLVLGLTYILSAFIDQDRSTIQSLYSLWSYYLPVMYSGMSFLGVLFLLSCTPLGFSLLFTVVGQLVVKPQFLTDINEQYMAAQLESEALKKKIENTQVSHMRLPAPITPEYSPNGRRVPIDASLDYLEKQLDTVHKDITKLGILEHKFKMNYVTKLVRIWGYVRRSV